MSSPSPCPESFEILVIVSESVTRYLMVLSFLLPLILRSICQVCFADVLLFSVETYALQDCRLASLIVRRALV